MLFRSLMVHSREAARVGRGVEEIAARALKTLPKLAPGVRAACELRVGAMHDRVAELPAGDRVAAIVALGYALHERCTAAGAAWGDCARALDAVHAHVGSPSLTAWESWAAQVAAEVLG